MSSTERKLHGTGTLTGVSTGTPCSIKYSRMAWQFSKPANTWSNVVPSPWRRISAFLIGVSGFKLHNKHSLSQLTSLMV